MDATDATATRRTVLAATAGAAAAAGAPRATAQDQQLEEHLSDVDNYDGDVEDATGQEEVTVQVGAGENGLRFAPPAIRVSAGATVVWEWTGEGGAHNVASVEGSGAEFRSGEPVDSDSETFERTFEEPGQQLYVCEPHRGAGMRGAVVVGDAGSDDAAADDAGGGSEDLTTVAGVVALLLVPFAAVVAMLGREIASGPGSRDRSRPRR